MVIALDFYIRFAAVKEVTIYVRISFLVNL